MVCPQKQSTKKKVNILCIVQAQNIRVKLLQEVGFYDL